MRTLDDKLIVSTTMLQELPGGLLVVQETVQVSEQDLNLASSCMGARMSGDEGEGEGEKRKSQEAFQKQSTGGLQ